MCVRSAVSIANFLVVPRQRAGIDQSGVVLALVITLINSSSFSRHPREGEIDWLLMLYYRSMPIGESEWKSVEPKSSVFTEVRMFLQENPSQAYTAGEVATDYSGRNADGDPSVQAQNMAVVLETLAWVSYTFNGTV